MKVVLLSVFLLSGCLAGINYNNIESLQASEVLTSAERFDCNNPTADELDKKAHSFKNYAEFNSGKETVILASELFKLTSELNLRYTNNEPSKAYCELKINRIKAAAKRIAATMGGKVR